MNAPPLVSILINNYNYARYLGEAIESALSQSYEPLEVIVVDDGSTDHSREVIQQYAARVTVILKENGGQGSAFNAGYEAAGGDIIVFLDADDVLLPDAVATAVAALDAQATRVHWPLWEIDEHGRRNGRLQPVGQLAQGDLFQKTVDDGPLPGVASPTSGNAWNRGFLQRIMPVPESTFRINADAYLVTLSWIYGEVRALPQPLALYRVHGMNRFAALGPHARRLRHREMFLHRCDALAQHLEALGIAPNAARWKRRKAILDWDTAFPAASAQLEEVLPPGAEYILIDEGAFTDAEHSLAMGRPVLRFLDGRLPADDADAIRELDRLLERAEYVVIPWVTKWWLDYYHDFDAHLRARCSIVFWSDELAVLACWATRVATACRQLEAVLPVGKKIILVDENSWIEETRRVPVLRGALPFLEENGLYAGNPADDEQAIAELKRLRAGGAEFLVFPWFTQWWLDHYRGLAAHLQQAASCHAANEYITVFELTTP